MVDVAVGQEQGPGWLAEVLLHVGAEARGGREAEAFEALQRALDGGINLIDGEIEYAGDQPLFRAENGIVIPLFDHPVKRARTGSAMFRPQDLRIVVRNAEPFGDQIRFSGRIERTEFLGSSLRHWIDLAGKVICLDLPRDTTRNTLHIGDQILIGLDPANIRILER